MLQKALAWLRQNEINNRTVGVETTLQGYSDFLQFKDKGRRQLRAPRDQQQLHRTAMLSMQGMRMMMEKAGRPQEDIDQLEAWILTVGRMVDRQDTPLSMELGVPARATFAGLKAGLKEKMVGREMVSSPISHLLGSEMMLREGLDAVMVPPNVRGGEVLAGMKTRGLPALPDIQHYALGRDDHARAMADLAQDAARAGMVPPDVARRHTQGQGGEGVLMTDGHDGRSA